MNIRTRLRVVCISCLRERVLEWDDDYTQWLCDECRKHLPRNIKSKRFRKLKSKFYQRKLAKRDVEKWLKKESLNLEQSTKSNGETISK